MGLRSSCCVDKECTNKAGETRQEWLRQGTGKIACQLSFASLAKVRKIKSLTKTHHSDQRQTNSFAAQEGKEPDIDFIQISYSYPRYGYLL